MVKNTITIRYGCNIILAFFLAMLCSSCGQKETVPESLPNIITETVETETESIEPETETLEKQEKLGRGHVVYGEGQEPLNSDQENLLLAYMDDRFESLAHLTVLESDHLFISAAQAQANEASTMLQVELRSMQEADYSLVNYEYELECRTIERREDGTVSIFGVENSIQNFAQNPDIDAERYGTYHRFTLEQVDGQWYISSHRLVDTLYLVLARNNWTADISPAYIEQLPEYLELIREQYNLRKEQRGQAAQAPETDHSYDREAATAYAEAYAHERNRQWADYSRQGGNCQNYSSQCLLAGGIPMDTTGGAVWKWYGGAVSNGGGASGRSSSWTGVNQFIDYAQQNTGYGLVALADAPYYSGEPGDLIHMGTQGNWRHTVVISDLVLNEEGETVDYLVYSNTGDMKNYPASLYGYPYNILTKIYGWNE